MKKLFEILIILLLAGSVYAQVTVAPVTLHMSDADRNGYIVVKNNSSTTSWEVSILMKFGYPASDSTGRTYIYFPETENESDPSAVDWISFFPRKFILKPQEEQTVRITAKPKNISEGEYWGRPVVTSHPAISIGDDGSENINAGIGVEFRTVIALNYRKGSVYTGIKFDTLFAAYENGKFIVKSNFSREGNSAYLGNLVVKIFNESGKKVKEMRQDISVYYSLNKSIEIPADKLPEGRYTVEASINTDRDEPGAKILKGNTATRKIFVTKS
jgi:hypothetical protein